MDRNESTMRIPPTAAMAVRTARYPWAKSRRRRRKSLCGLNTPSTALCIACLHGCCPAEDLRHPFGISGHGVEKGLEVQAGLFVPRVFSDHDPAAKGPVRVQDPLARGLRGLEMRREPARDFAHGLLEDDPALIQHDEGVDEIFHVPHLVRGNQDYSVLTGCPGKQLAKLALCRYVQPLCGLVEEKHIAA